jgi:hypothetical protein
MTLKKDWNKVLEIDMLGKLQWIEIPPVLIVSLVLLLRSISL